ncbi:MAG TPA: carbohydrate ABC transporter permease [Spirochaetia bacterium]|nr:carbohydrate ABC transporter permease [Spirochaetia bacterium]
MKASVGRIAFEALVWVAFLLFTLICVFPFYYIFINTISDNKLAETGKVLFLPVGIHLQNYVQVARIRGLVHAALVSVARTVLGTAFTLLGSSWLGYCLSKREMWMRKLSYRFVVVTLYFNAGLIPWFVTMKMLGLVNNFWAYVLPAIVSPFYLILFKTFIESIPEALEESAQMDGAGYVARYLRIILPLSTSILATIAVFASVGQWNSFVDTLFLMTKSNLFTLQFLLYQYLNEVNSIAALMRTSPQYGQTIDPSKLLNATSIRMTISMVVVIPILIVYPYFQRFFVKGIMIGAIKG